MDCVVVFGIRTRIMVCRFCLENFCHEPGSLMFSLYTSQVSCLRFFDFPC